MPDTERPKLYILTPPEFELSAFPARLDEVLDAHEIACLRLSLATKDEDRLSRAADAVRVVAHAQQFGEH